ncbi:HEAT repeat domain-containing protein [Haliangium sp.]|uniref:HEAT repeat domain-containing protein n=1 Tax=Haliangium sp. TaxID=2663208 RepID=UPI003D0A20DF
MSRRLASPYRLVALLAVALLGSLATGCIEDEFDPETWIDKLDDSDAKTVEEAITRLQRLKDPVAIKPLAKVWRERGRSDGVLRVIIELASQGKDGEPAWDDALPVLRSALEDLDDGDNRSVQNAIMAADALGEAKDKDSIEVLVKVVTAKMRKQSPGQGVRLAAVSALGKFGSEPRAVDTLIGVLESKVDSQPPQLFAAAALALADARSPKAVVPLLAAMFKIAPIYPQCRRALVAIGKPAIAELIKVFEGKHEQMNALAKDNEFNIDCDKQMGPDSKCQAPSNLEFKAAALLGDLYAKEAVPALTKGLTEPALPAFFLPNGAPGPLQHLAILDALRKINDDGAIGAVRDYWKDSKTDDQIRPLAMDVYSTLTDSTDELDALAKLIKDDDQEEQIRMSAGQAYGRLVRSGNDLGPLQFMVERYKKEATKHDREAAKSKKKAEKASGDKKAKLEQEAAYSENRAAGYRNYQRAFEQNLARAKVGIQCKADPKCYADILEQSGDEIGKSMSGDIDGFDKWSESEKEALKLAASERALFELAKMGEKGRPAMDAILKHVESSDRIMRQGTLLAMVHVAALPCDKCIARLDEVIDDQKGESTLAQLTVDTQTVRNYFLWAGK